METSGVCVCEKVAWRRLTGKHRLGRKSATHMQRTRVFLYMTEIESHAGRKGHHKGQEKPPQLLFSVLRSAHPAEEESVLKGTSYMPSLFQGFTQINSLGPHQPVKSHCYFIPVLQVK